MVAAPRPHLPFPTEVKEFSGANQIVPGVLCERGSGQVLTLATFTFLLSYKQQMQEDNRMGVCSANMLVLV